MHVCVYSASIIYYIKRKVCWVLWRLGLHGCMRLLTITWWVHFGDAMYASRVVTACRLGLSLHQFIRNKCTSVHWCSVAIHLSHMHMHVPELRTGSESYVNHLYLYFISILNCWQSHLDCTLRKYTYIV